MNVYSPWSKVMTFKHDGTEYRLGPLAVTDLPVAVAYHAVRKMGATGVSVMPDGDDASSREIADARHLEYLKAYHKQLIHPPARQESGAAHEPHPVAHEIAAAIKAHVDRKEGAAVGSNSGVE